MGGNESDDHNSGNSTLLKARHLLAWINRYYFRLVFGLPLGIMFFLWVGVLANSKGWPEINFLLALLFIMSAFALAFHPLVQLVRAGGHMITDAVPSLQQYARAVMHVLLFAGIIFSVLGTLKIQKLEAMLPVFVLLLLTGFAFYLWPNRIWYKRIVWFSLFVLFSVWIIWVYSANHTPDKEAEEKLNILHEKRLSRGLTPEEQLEWNKLQEKDRRQGFIESVRARMGTLYEPVKKEVRITDLKSHVLTGLDDLPAGCYTFQTEGPMVADGNGGRWWLHADLRLNGKIPGERICFDAISPPVLSFVTGLPPSLALPQNIGITFTWAP